MGSSGKRSWAERLGSSSTKRLGSLRDPDFLLSCNALSQLGLEGSTGRIKHKLR